MASAGLVGANAAYDQRAVLGASPAGGTTTTAASPGLPGSPFAPGAPAGPCGPAGPGTGTGVGTVTTWVDGAGAGSGVTATGVGLLTVFSQPVSASMARTAALSRDFFMVILSLESQ